MIHDTIQKIEARIRRADSINPEARDELIRLLATLKGEVTDLAETHHDEAHSIAGFTDVSTHEATRETRDPRLLKLSIEGLSSSVDGFGKSHPKLVQLVNRICETLANLGV